MADEDIKTFNYGKIVSGRWKVISKLGEGGMGAVYKVEDKNRPNYFAAMKVEDDLSEGGVLKLEVEVLKSLQTCPHTLRLLDSGSRDKYCFMVMTLSGNDLMSLKRKAGRPFSESTTLRLAIGTLYAIKQCHEAGFIHRDIKPGNFMMGCVGRDTRMIYLIDYGMCRRWVCKDPKDGKFKMRAPRAGEQLFRGTPRYCSMSVHNRNEQGRVDDLWSWLYMLVELHCGLPWNRLQDEDEIKAEKERYSPEQVLKNCPPEFLPIHKYLFDLKFASKPDYFGLYTECNFGLKRVRGSFLDKYEWEKGQEKRDLTTALSISDTTLKEKKQLKRHDLAKKCYPWVGREYFKKDLYGF